jgi:hypothetical protein
LGYIFVDPIWLKNSCNTLQQKGFRKISKNATAFAKGKIKFLIYKKNYPEPDKKN